ncbi:hypothetical protein GCM10027168_69280 [Streptomyces capparidis]
MVLRTVRGDERRHSRADPGHSGQTQHGSKTGRPERASAGRSRRAVEGVRPGGSRAARHGAGARQVRQAREPVGDVVTPVAYNDHDLKVFLHVAGSTDPEQVLHDPGWVEWRGAPPRQWNPD